MTYYQLNITRKELEDILVGHLYRHFEDYEGIILPKWSMDTLALIVRQHLEEFQWSHFGLGNLEGDLWGHITDEIIQSEKLATIFPLNMGNKYLDNHSATIVSYLKDGFPVIEAVSTQIAEIIVDEILQALDEKLQSLTGREDVTIKDKIFFPDYKGSAKLPIVEIKK